jgi:AcrR family transcriptional regulator
LRDAQIYITLGAVSNPDASAGGLRERKKEQTREALSMATLRLAVEKGFENVLVEDIAAAAGVSPRTFNNYFSSKAEAIAWRHLTRSRRVAQLIRDRPTTEPLWESITSAAVAQAGNGSFRPDASWTAGVRLMMTSPELQGEILRAEATAEREWAAAIAERTGLDVEVDLYPRLLAAAVGAAIGVATEQWQRATPPVPLAGLLRAALNQLANGLPPPKTAPLSQ